MNRALVSAAEDVPRRPHDTIRCRIVREELTTFLARTERTYAAPLPKYVIDTFDHADQHIIVTGSRRI